MCACFVPYQVHTINSSTKIVVVVIRACMVYAYECEQTNVPYAHNGWIEWKIERAKEINKRTIIYSNERPKLCSLHQSVLSTRREQCTLYAIRVYRQMVTRRQKWPKTVESQASIIDHRLLQVYPGHYLSKTGTTFVFGQSRGSWGVCFDMIPGCSHVWLQKDRCTRFWLVMPFKKKIREPAWWSEK